MSTTRESVEIDWDKVTVFIVQFPKKCVYKALICFEKISFIYYNVIYYLSYDCFSVLLHMEGKISTYTELTLYHLN